MYWWFWCTSELKNSLPLSRSLQQVSNLTTLVFFCFFWEGAKHLDSGDKFLSRIKMNLNSCRRNTADSDWLQKLLSHDKDNLPDWNPPSLGEAKSGYVLPWRGAGSSRGQDALLTYPVLTNIYFNCSDVWSVIRVPREKPTSQPCQLLVGGRWNETKWNQSKMDKYNTISVRRHHSKMHSSYVLWRRDRDQTVRHLKELGGVWTWWTSHPSSWQSLQQFSSGLCSPLRLDIYPKQLTKTCPAHPSQTSSE